MTAVAPPELDRLRAVEVEHRLTLRVLAVTVDQLLFATDSEQIVLSMAAVAGAPVLSAWRDRASGDYVLTVAP